MKQLVTKILNRPAYWVLTLLALAPAAQAVDRESLPALRGYDPVSYFEMPAPMPGSGYFVEVHEGQTYLFSSEKNRNSFRANPQKYLPQYGGWCAYGVALGKKVHGDPLAYAVEGGKLYLNVNPDVLKSWLKGKDKLIKQADERWTRISETKSTQL